MIVSESFLSSLRQYFNLNMYEVKIWVALLSRGLSTAGELSDIGDVPRSRAYDILASLEKKGFVASKIGKPIKYMAVEPAEVVERAKKLVKKDAEEGVKNLESLKGTPAIKELESLYKQGSEFIKPTEISGAIKGRSNLYTHMDTIFKKAKKSIVLVTTAKGLERKVGTLKPTFQALKAKGVKIKIATQVNKDSMKAVKELLPIAEVRNCNINARFCLVDDKEVMFMMMDDDDVHPSYDTAVWTSAPLFASALNDLFEASWTKMEPASKAVKQ